MAKTSGPNPIGIVLPGSTPFAPPPLLKEGIARIPSPIRQQWAPAWFYSALNWLGKPYFDASNVRAAIQSLSCRIERRSLRAPRIDAPLPDLFRRRRLPPLDRRGRELRRLCLGRQALSEHRRRHPGDVSRSRGEPDLPVGHALLRSGHARPGSEPLRERIRGHGSPRFLREWLRPSDGPQGRRSGLRGLTNRSARRLPQYPQRADLQRRAGHRPVRLGTRL